MGKGSKLLLIVAIVLIAIGSVFAIVKNTEKKHVKNKAEGKMDFSNIIDKATDKTVETNKTTDNNIQENAENLNDVNSEKTLDNSIDTKKILVNVINNKQKLINKDNQEIYFKDFEIVENQKAEVDKYAFVDMDKDGTEELVIYTTSDYGAYIILHYENNKVYGYMIGNRSFENLKIDGSFMRSSGADSVEYSRMTFNKNSYSIKKEAVYDVTNKVYEIDNTSVSEKEIKEYVEKWNKKENVNWNK